MREILLRDKNGKRIFEGDIVALQKGGKAFAVEWDEFTARYLLTRAGRAMIELDEKRASRLEIVGNIYEIPELLEVFDHA